MTSFYSWLRKYKVVNIFLVIAYYLLVVLPHEQVGIFIAKTLDQPYGRDTYNLIILVIGLVGLVGYLLPIWRGTKQLESGKNRVWMAFLVSVALIIVSFNMLLVVNVEIIHFIQYGVLAILMMPLFENYGDTLFFATVLAVLDEGYQYFVLAPLRTEYFDFNDIIIDLIGAAMGLLLLWIVGVKNEIEGRKWFKTPRFIGFAAITIGSLIAYLSGTLAIYPSEGDVQAPILLIRKIQESFWTIIHPNVKFHVVRPLEGLIILGMLFYFYAEIVFGKPLRLKTSPTTS
ncbi:MAG: VanZ family protein [Bacteroidota bacterium]